MRLTKDGNLGIGTTSPGSKLDVNGIITARVMANIGNDCEMISIGKTPGSSALAYSTSYIGFNAERISADEWLIRSDNLHNGGAVIYGTIGGDMIFSCIKTEADGSTDQSLTDTQIKDNAQMMLSQDGILKVNEVEVKLNVWSDYVFNEDYNLPKLSEVESFIKENNHLPDVPSEVEVLEEGINLGQMDALLLKKIEELTLYVIELKKENEVMKEDYSKMKAEIENILRTK